MKQKISITIDEHAILNILRTVESGKFRNKSHFVEYAVKRLLEEENGG
jgi:Arc/MetJ-type ribon-helix-helix transcriptional regulator